jgi:hypothetical protein
LFLVPVAAFCAPRAMDDADEPITGTLSIWLTAFLTGTIVTLVMNFLEALVVWAGQRNNFEREQSRRQ